MELSNGQQRMLFAVLVLLLAGLGIYLLGPARHHASAAPSTSPPTPTTSSAPAVAASSPATAVPPTTVPPYTPPPTIPVSAGGVDIYQWLPFSQQDLAQAAHVTLAFAAEYDTFSYTETPPAYASKMASMVTSELGAKLENDYATLEVATQRAAQKQVSTGTGGIVSIKSFGSGSITFLVSIAQQLTTTTGTSARTTQYVVTVISAGGGGWQVNDIEQPGLGNS
jgi:hypothetical protein